jgi:catechol 2,3-dioxygenase-like lactoylglutathione lyase family enzyme
MFDHVTIHSSDRAAAERFYDTVLGTLGIDRRATGRLFTEWGEFSVAQASQEHPATRGLHIGFVAPSRQDVDEFWRTGTEAGYRDDGAPGPRPQYAENYYGGFLLDPDGNSAEAVHNPPLPAGRAIDHLWIRVSQLDEAKRFYETIAPQAGFELKAEPPGRAQFAGRRSGSFSVVSGTPTQHVHIAFAADTNGTVERFHQVATAAGYRDNGGPGERPLYHPGYYGAFVLDPDGNNVELVCHNR